MINIKNAEPTKLGDYLNVERRMQTNFTFAFYFGDGTGVIMDRNKCIA
jgi:hypothetical protein